MSAAQDRLLAKLIATLRDEPHTWRLGAERGRRTIIHISGVEVWKSYEYHVWRPVEIKFGFWATRRLKRAVKRWFRTRGKTEQREADDAAADQVFALLIKPVQS